MLKSLELKNFQSHEYSRFEFSPGINSIIGSSDSGKSAVLRGLDWVISNRPSGNSFISFWNKNDRGKIIDNTQVSLEKIDGTVISRRKSDTFNGYSLNSDVFEAIRMDVPGEISESLNLTDVNFQKQLDAPFMLSQTSGEIAKYLNKLINLDSIDRTLSCAASKKRDEKKKLEIDRERLQDCEESIKKFSFLDRLKELLKTWETLDQEKKNTESQIFKIQTLRNDYKLLRKKIKTYQPMLSQKENILKIEKLSGEREKNTIAITELKALLDRYTNNEKNLKSVVRYVELGEKGILSRIEKKQEELSEVKDLINFLNSSINSYNKMSATQRLSREKIEEYKSQIPEVCPVCNGTGRLK